MMIKLQPGCFLPCLGSITSSVLTRDLNLNLDVCKIWLTVAPERNRIGFKDTHPNKAKPSAGTISPSWRTASSLRPSASHVKRRWFLGSHCRCFLPHLAACLTTIRIRKSRSVYLRTQEQSSSSWNTESDVQIIQTLSNLLHALFRTSLHLCMDL